MTAGAQRSVSVAIAICGLSALGSLGAAIWPAPVLAIAGATLAAISAGFAAWRLHSANPIPAQRQREDAIGSDRLTGTLNALPQGVAHFSQDGRLRTENGRWRSFLLPSFSGPILGQSFETLMRLAARSAIDAQGKEDAWVTERVTDFRETTSLRRIPMLGGRVLSLSHRRVAGGETVSIAVDATELETARASLEAMRQQSVSFLDNIADAVLVVDERGTIERANTSAERMFALPRGAMLGRSAAILFAADMPGEANHLGGAPAEILGRIVEGHGRRSDGAVFPIEVSLGEISADWRLTDRRASQRKGFVATLRDLTAKVETERHLRQAQKLEAVGTLAGGIAHDFNNLLAIVLGYTNLSLADAPEHDVELRESLTAIETAAKRGKDLVRQLLTFSRGSGETRAPLDVAPLVKEAAKLVRATLPPGIDLRLSIGEGSTTTVGNATQIHQVLLNLCTNAVQALSSRAGSIEIGVRNVERTADGPGDGLPPGRYVCVSVTDDGPGIDPSIVDRIFEPFFTTKEVGQGTGLGLAVAHGILRDHGGGIRVESTPGKGACFEAFLPVHEGPVEAQSGAAVRQSTGKGERILVVEDESALRHVIERALLRLGYRVAATGDAAQALAWLQAAPFDHDAILTDFSMPTMSGTALSEAARRLGVKAPIILSTGGRKIDAQKAQSLGIVAQILKPSIIDEIGPALRNALDA